MKSVIRSAWSGTHKVVIAPVYYYMTMVGQ